MIEPALREKKRYVVLETKELISMKEVKDNLYKECLAFLGEKGTGELSLEVVTWSKNRGVVKVSHLKTKELKTILGLIKSMKAKTIKTTGSLKKAKKIMEEK